MTSQIPTQEDYLKGYLNKMIRGDGSELDAYVSAVEKGKIVEDTHATARCYMINFNGQDFPRSKDLGKVLVEYLLDYSIPRHEIRKAQSKDFEMNTTKHIAALHQKARTLFTTVSKTGEPGEVLLYLMTQSILKLPQAIAKMSLKTSSQLHYNGADGVHLGYDSKNQKLNIYWGEAKLYQNHGEAIKNCFESLAPFLAADGSNRVRDLDLLTSNLSTLEEDFANALINYLDPDHPSYNSLEFKGVCLIGFDYTKYPKKQRLKKQQQILSEILKDLDNWINKLKTAINSHLDLNKMVIEIFIIPFPSVSEFRSAFLEVLNSD
ncbi:MULTISPECIES: HamA C-terminal domain-containing protein [unclassified Bacillus (in: firmicutes)]|uniref:HamA C-terminal domain-containing protein n=1 Tax=Bacillus TaxID=1386 RepID=UPI00071D0A94|nr:MULTISPECIES: DUF1837 domain-containing protein [unclassified Bacillus (in: firmicutes)]KRV45861.1 hypothetical protein AS196_12215 [Bacillus sp. TH007]